MKNKISKVSYTKTKRKRNVWLFDAGLHTLHLDKKEGEQDQEYVTRWLIEFLDGCRNRGGKQYKDYFIQHNKGQNYISVLAVK